MTIDRDSARALIAEARATMQRQEWMPASLAIRLADALEAALSAVPVEGEVECAKEWAATLESVLADVYTILQPIATEGTHAANSPIQRAYDILNSQDFDKWQASRPFTEEDVEAAAKVIYEGNPIHSYVLDGPVPWDDPDFEVWAQREVYLGKARAALDAVTARHTKGDGA